MSFSLERGRSSRDIPRIDDFIETFRRVMTEVLKAPDVPISSLI